MTSKPNLDGTVAGYFEKTWYEQDLDWTGRFLHTPYMADNGYGKDMALTTGDAALLLQLDYTNAQKAPLLITFVQYGIDIYGILTRAETGMPMAVTTAAGSLRCWLLRPCSMTAALKAKFAGSAKKFQEFQQTFTVTQADVNMTGRVGTNGDPVYNYTSRQHRNGRVGHPSLIGTPKGQQLLGRPPTGTSAAAS